MHHVVAHILIAILLTFSTPDTLGDQYTGTPRFLQYTDVQDYTDVQTCGRADVDM